MPLENNNEKNVVRGMDSRIRDFKFKILIFVFMILMYILYPFLSDSFAQIQKLTSENETLTQKSASLEIEKSNVESDFNVIKYVEKNKMDVVNCLNNNTCWNISIPWIRFDSKVNVVKSYLSLVKYDWEKMSYDQKTILRNILDYLIIDSERGFENWKINIIAFGVPTLVSKDMDLYRLPITINIEFNDNNSLFSFIKNIEKRVDTRYSMLQKITAMNYDIVNYQQKQMVNITIDTYFYK